MLIELKTADETRANEKQFLHSAYHKFAYYRQAEIFSLMRLNLSFALVKEKTDRKMKVLDLPYSNQSHAII